MVVRDVDGRPLRDILDWLWLSDAEEVTLAVDGAGGGIRSVTMARNLSQPWGLAFADPLFDGVMECANDCGFCFIDMLPPGMRPGLYLRDDDYRLSFLQGSFVTLTNLGDDDLRRIIDMRLSPLHVSLHAVDPDVRREMMGYSAQRGIEALEQLLAAGMEAHAQVVLVPGHNDGTVLEETLAWVDERPELLSIGIVPYAHTRYARSLGGYSPSQAAALIEGLLGLAPRVQLADEWFLLAGRPLPPAGYYGSYPLYENGIGLVRSFIDDWPQAGPGGWAPGAAGPAGAVAAPAILVTGTGFAPTLQGLIDDSPWASRLQVLAVPNRFFGGSVDATGLLTAADIIDAFTGPKATGFSPGLPVVVPAVAFNADGLTLDGWTADRLGTRLERPVHVVGDIAELLPGA
jgi:putative radical SAM enzyme (TIGR03279 family)